MKALKLAVAEPSAILRCGIIAVLRRLPAPDVDILEIADISQLTVQLSRHRPDVLVVNPASLGFCTPQQLRVQTGCEGLRCIALQMSVTDAATLNAYDDVLSVYDPVETLREKIMQPVGDAPREERQEPLSAREREIVVCIVKMLEIGCGKGQFAREIAKRNPDKNFLAVEKSSNVIVDAAQMAIDEGIPNLRFARGEAEYLDCFIPEKSVECIYLNFSCPYPKNTYARHRLTYRAFLEIYRRILVDKGEIYQKTDNMHFFEFSLEEFSAANYGLKNISLDLHNSGFEGNIVTEYEKKFSDMGMPIYRLEAFVK